MKIFEERTFTKKSIILFLLLIFVAFTVPWSLQLSLSGKAPSEKFSQTPLMQPIEEELPPELSALKEAAKANPGDLEKWRAFSSALYNKLQSDEDAPPNLLLELIQALQNVLSLDPKDAQSLLLMADTSFSQRIFNKAAEFYRRYLEVKPDDNHVRAVYASSLTFLGKTDEAIFELQNILKEDPSNFQATAYLAITYAELGDIEKARETGKKSIELGPSEEAKQRMNSFLDSLSKTDNPKVEKAEH